jgi:hypothetical protein
MPEQLRQQNLSWRPPFFDSQTGQLFGVRVPFCALSPASVEMGGNGQVGRMTVTTNAAISSDMDESIAACLGRVEVAPRSGRSASHAPF